MRKIIFTLTVIVMSACVAFSQQWDRHMVVKNMEVRIKADAFTATTFIQMEFYNPTDTEMEGLYSFNLDTGQAITAFQLDLFGKFRDGSIEEKWKARAAYNTIVGKRVDPALLQMDYANHYSLRIYPVPAKGSRKITMTIEQVLAYKNGSAWYCLPLAIRDTIGKFNTVIKVTKNKTKPVTSHGIIWNESFRDTDAGYELTTTEENFMADRAIQFYIPMELSKPYVCVKSRDNKTFFAVRLKPELAQEYSVTPRSITVFWDVSASGAMRNLQAEIEFLKKYISEKNISTIDIITFNHEIKDTAIFHCSASDTSWSNYLRKQKYDGAKQFGILNFSHVNGDVILLFSNGKNSFGKDLPVPGNTHVYCVGSIPYTDFVHLQKIVGNSGGRNINLSKLTMQEALTVAGKAENILFAITSSKGAVNEYQVATEAGGNTMLITGNCSFAPPDLLFYFGNNSVIRKQEQVVLGNNENAQCDNSAIERIAMLATFADHIRSYDWRSTPEFGRRERVVTQSTSYIVLEKIDDYIKYKITPPAELESECDMNYFTDAAEKRKQDYKKQNEFDILSGVAELYNEKLKWWDVKESLIILHKEETTTSATVATTGQPASPTVNDKKTNSVTVAPAFPADAQFVTGTEVVVTAMGQTRAAKEMGFSTAKVRATELTQAKPVSLELGLTGKVSGLNVQTVNNGVFADTRLTLRGIRSLTGNNQPLLVLDGLPVSLSYIKSINVNDVLDVMILKGNSATSIYGSDGVNGALVITTKKGRRTGGGFVTQRGLYTLSDCEDEDYLQEIKSAETKDKLAVYRRLKPLYTYSKGFFIDMSEYLYTEGFRKEALDIIFSTADMNSGDRKALMAIAYTLESLNEFDKAIGVYQALLALDSNDIHAYRDLSLSYYQNGNYQQTVDLLYRGIAKNYIGNEAANLVMKSMMLQELNAIIAVHREAIDISEMNIQLIKPLPVDLRITLDCNNADLYNSISIAEPGREVCSYQKNLTKNGGYISTDRRLLNINNSAEEYQIKKAKKGYYKIRVNYMDSWGGYYRTPTMIKMMIFKNFGKPGQTITVKNAIMDNQFGLVEIGEVEW